jgi:hypothetical protein
MWTRAAHRLASLRRRIYWSLHGAHRGQKRILFVCGAAKSGKTLLCNMLERDMRATVFREESALSGRDGNRLRFKSFSEVAAVFERCPTPIIVAEAKVESQRAAELLRAFPDARVLWVWRHFKGAVAADLRRFSSQRETLLAVVRGDPTNWRSEGVSPVTREVVCARYSPDLPRPDVAALFWYVRNTLWFDQGLDRSPSAYLVQYEEFCRSPDSVLRHIYDAMGLPMPMLDAGRSIDLSFLETVPLDLRSDTEALCAGLVERLARSGQGIRQRQEAS